MPDISNLNKTWNNASTTFTAVKMDVTDTASASGSKLLDLLVGGTSKFSVGKTGDALINGLTVGLSAGQIIGNTVIGYNALPVNSSGWGSTAVGYRAMKANSTGGANVAIGYTALFSQTTGGNSIAVGYRAAYNSTTAAGSVAIGRDALYSATTNPGTAVGYQALYNATGGRNTAVGYQSGFSVTTATDQSLFGFYAGREITTGANNCSFGSYSLRGATTAVNSTAMGWASLYGITTGGSNSGFGHEAGRYIADGATANTTGSNSVFLGALTKANADGETNQIVIGYNVIGKGSNTAVLGNDNITDTYLKGTLHFGTYTAIGAETIDGYITIVDAGGTTRKIATVA